MKKSVHWMGDQALYNVVAHMGKDWYLTRLDESSASTLESQERQIMAEQTAPVHSNVIDHVKRIKRTGKNSDFFYLFVNTYDLFSFVSEIRKSKGTLPREFYSQKLLKLLIGRFSMRGHTVMAHAEATDEQFQEFLKLLIGRFSMRGHTVMALYDGLAHTASSCLSMGRRCISLEAEEPYRPVAQVNSLCYIYFNYSASINSYYS